MTFWETWGSLVQRLLASVGSQASLVALLLVFAPQPLELKGWTLALIVLAMVLAVVSVWLEVTAERKAHRGRKVYLRDDAEGIKAYMRSWIDSSGRAAIWTRDLSWADDDQTRRQLEAKASSGNLDIFVPIENDLCARLRGVGARVHVYGGRRMQAPASRFTIAFFGNGGSKVAIGRAVAGMHVIEELGTDDPAFHMATDLIAIAGLLAERGGSDAGRETG